MGRDLINKERNVLTTDYLTTDYLSPSYFLYLPSKQSLRNLNNVIVIVCMANKKQREAPLCGVPLCII